MAGERDLPTFLWDYETNRAIHEVLPGVVSDAFGVATHFGDGPTLAALVVLFYWFGRAERWHARGLLVGIAVAALALNVGLKGVLDVQRPLFAAAEAGDPLAFAPDAYDGLSTPSGHAMGSAAVYGGLAALTAVAERAQRYAVAGVVILAVALSRVVIGVHYLGDVILGVALGLAVVWFGRRLHNERGQAALALFAVALVGTVVAWMLGSGEHLARSVGMPAGGAIVWWQIRDNQPAPARASTLLAGLLMVPVAVALVALDVVVAIDPTVQFQAVELPVLSGVRALGYAVLTGSALAVPVIAERFDDHPVARWLQRLLPLDDGPVEHASERADETGD